MAGINASSGQTFSNVDSILKDFYLGPVREQLNFSSVLMHRMKRDLESVSGRQVIIPVHTGRNEGISGVSDGGFLPDPGAQAWKQLKFPVQYTYGRLMITGPTISAAKNDRGAFLRTLDASIKGLTRDFKKEFNRIMFGDGSGCLDASVTLAGSGTGLTTLPALDGFFQSGVEASRKGYLIRPGMFVALIKTTSGGAGTQKDSDDKNATAVVAANEVVSVDSTAGTITISDNYNIGSDGYIASAQYELFRAARLTAGTNSTTARLTDTSAWKEPMGLAGIVGVGNPTGTSSFQGLDASDAANSFWRSNLTTSAALTFSVMQTVIDEMAMNGDGAAPSLIITDYAQRRKYYELWSSTAVSASPAERRFANTMTLDGGFQALEFNGIPLVADIDCTSKRMYFLDEKELALFRNEDFFWLDRDGKILHRLEDKDAYQATLAHYCEYGTYRRNSHGAIIGLAN